MSVLTRNRPIPKQSRGACSAKPVIPKSSSDCENCSVTEARLERAARSPRIYHDTYLKWWNRFTDLETYPSQEMKVRVEVLEREILALTRLRERPSSGMSGREWTEIADRHDRLKAQAQAIYESLERREWNARRSLPRRAGSTSRPTSTPLTTTVGLEPGTDPFSQE